MKPFPVLLAAGCCVILACADNLGPTSGSLHILAATIPADTVGSISVSPLEIEVRQTNGQPARDVRIRFQALGTPAEPQVTFVRLTSQDSLGNVTPTSASLEATRRTDRNGRASVPIFLSGTKAGRAAVLIEAPTLGEQDTAYYDVLPGNPVVFATIGRSGAVIGDTFTVRPQYRDRHGNLNTPPSSCSASAPEISLTGCKVTALAFGSVAITVWPDATPQRVDTVRISMVPRGEIAVHNWLTSSSSPIVLTLQALDGSSVRTLAPSCTTGSARGCSSRPGDWFASGDRLVVVHGAQPERLPQSFAISILDLNGNVTPLTYGTPSEQEPELSPDEQWVYFTKSLAGSTGTEIWRVRTDGSSAQRSGPESTNNRRDRSASVSPDGSRLVYVQGAESALTPGDLVVLDLMTAAVTPLGVKGYLPKWSPTGEWIAFGADPIRTAIMRPDGSGRREFFVFGGPSGGPRDWSPDGKYLVGTSGSGISTVWLTEVATGKFLSLTHFSNRNSPSWRPGS